uniref:Piwi domain-containing protein n=1 Tax=Glossina brevipalpis TaxID=37001 RepID=A0A1A9X3J3_9MUSC
MICGIDVYRETTTKAISVAAFVASLDNNCTKWYSKAIIQNEKAEILNGLCCCLISALNAYQSENKVFPDNIIIYRDGVGDGQLQVCENYEIPQLEEACRKLLEQVVKITFIVVKKHTNTRYFSMNQNGFESPAPGTIVDKTITRTGSDNFFLISQTVKPRPRIILCYGMMRNFLPI